MKKRSIFYQFFTVCSLVFSQAAFAQNPNLPVWEKDDFSSNKFYKDYVEEGKKELKVKDGVLTYQCSSDFGTRQIEYATLSFLSREKPLAFQADFTLKSNASDQFFHGLLLKTLNDVVYYFGINDATQSYIVRYWDIANKKSGVIIDTKTSAFIKKDQANILKVFFNPSAEQQKGSFEFFVNGNKVESVDPLSENIIRSIGMYAEGKQVFTVDNFTVFQDNKINLAVKNNYVTKKENLGNGVNSIYHELAPRISPDESMLFFVREGDPGSGQKEDDQDIYFASSKDSGKTWSKAVNIGKPLNNSSANSVLQVSADNNILFLSGSYGHSQDDPKGDFDPNGYYATFSTSYRTANGWSEPSPQRIKAYYNNGKYRSISIAPSGNILVMSVDRDDSFGEEDLYVCFREGTDKWSAPLNLGKKLNTHNSDFNPFIAADERTLYFASYGHPGYGSADLFMTRRLDETWTNWSEPQNLGPWINTSSWDASFVISSTGKYAYVISSNESIGESDVFRIALPEQVKPDPVVVVSGQVFDSQTKQPISAFLTYSDLYTDDLLGFALASPEDGSYKIVLPYQKAYAIFADQTGYIAVNENLDLNKKGLALEIKKDLYLSPIKSGQSVRLNNLFFDTGKATLQPASFGELNRLVQSMKDNSSIHLEISGHTDNVGNAQTNQKLSEDRAKAVYNYLVSKGISSSRLQAVGYGMDKPIDVNTTEKGRHNNRRVEVKIL